MVTPVRPLFDYERKLVCNADRRDKEALEGFFVTRNGHVYFDRRNVGS
jgi:hypothetical protein